MQAAQPLLRWAGSKRQIVPILAKYWSDRFSRYVEPFAGSACLFFYLAPRTALLGDINKELVGTYRTVRRGYREIFKILRRMRREKRRYYEIRALQPNRLSTAKRAARFIYLNRYCFNGLYRTNLNGNFNVPYGAQGSGSLPSAEELRRASDLLKRATLIEGDFEKVLAGVKPGDFVYMDPPFSVSDRRMFREYDASVFTWKDVVRLRRCLRKLSDMGISFLVSYVESPEGEYLSEGFKTSVVSVRRSISGFLTSRIKCRELLISNLS